MMSATSQSNAGGPAARQGFKYQDHVAVSFIFKMLRDSSYSQVECETADDIVAVSHHSSGMYVYEYIQVKTTEDDRKWSVTEITALDGAKANSSLLHKSLKCDVRPGLARFRIVTKRDVAKSLEGFKTELDKRVLPDTTTERGKRLQKQFKTFTSRKSGISPTGLTTVSGRSTAMSSRWKRSISRRCPSLRKGLETGRTSPSCRQFTTNF